VNDETEHAGRAAEIWNAVPHAPISDVLFRCVDVKCERRIQSQDSPHFCKLGRHVTRKFGVPRHEQGLSAAGCFAYASGRG